MVLVQSIVLLATATCITAQFGGLFGNDFFTNGGLGVGSDIQFQSGLNGFDGRTSFLDQGAQLGALNNVAVDAQGNERAVSINYCSMTFLK